MDRAEITFRDDTRYAYAVGRIRALETKLLARADFSRLLDAGDYSQALRTMAELGYPASEEIGEHEPTLVLEQKRVLEIVEQLFEDPALIELFRRRYDFHNLKVLLKAKHSHQEMDQAIADLGHIPVGQMAEAVMAGEPQRLPDPLAQAMADAESAFAQSGSPADLDVAVERQQFAYLSRAVRSWRSSFMESWLTWEIDLLNIKSFFRLKWLEESVKNFDAVMLPGGSLEGGFFRHIREEPWEALAQIFQRTPYGRAVAEGIAQLKARRSFAALERSCDDLLMELLKTSRETSFGAEPVAAYLFMKELEIRGVRAVLVGKRNNLPKEKIKERLPSAYV